MKKKHVIIFIILVLMLVLGWLYHSHQATTSTAPEAVTWIKSEKVTVATMPVTIRTIANVVANKHSVLSAEIAGHVRLISIQDGEMVSSGALLIQLEDDTYQAKVGAAKAAETLSKQTLDRKQKLALTGVLSAQALDEAKADYQEKRAALDEAMALLNEATINAPFAGRAGKALVQPGDYIQVGQALTTLTDVSHLRVEYSVPEKYVGDIKLGQAVKVSAGENQDHVVTARVAYIAPFIDPTDRTVLVYATVDNEHQVLTPGMLVTVEEVLNTEKKALFVPARSLVAVVDGEQIYKIIDNKAYAVDVKVGTRTTDKAEVLSGLTKDDVIVTDGQQKLTNGVAVKVSA